MKRRLATVAVVLVALLVAWQLTVVVARRVVRGADQPATEVASTAAVDEALDALVEASLARATRLEASSEGREDGDGVWTVQVSRYRLPQGLDAAEVLSQLTALTTDSANQLAGPPPRLYLTPGRDLRQTLRVYQGKRLTHQVELVPELGAAPAPVEMARVAVVVSGLGADGPVGAAVLSRSVPLTLAFEPFAPFTLRQSRDAVVARKEVLVDLRGEGLDAPLQERLLAVIHPSGVLLEPGAGALDPGLLADQDLYVAAAEGAAPPSVLRALHDADIPRVTIDTEVVGDLTAHRLTLQHLAARKGAMVVTVRASDPSLGEVLDWVSDSRSGVRPVFLSEVLEERTPWTGGRLAEPLR